MLELTFRVSEIDYEAAMSQLAGSNPMAGMAGVMLRTVPADKRDEMAAKFLNNNAEKLVSMFESFGDQKGFHFKIDSAEVKAV